MSPESNDPIEDDISATGASSGVRYSDFQLRAWKADASHLQVLVHASPAGGMRRPITVPIDPAEMLRIQKAVQEDMVAASGDLGRMIQAGRELSDVLLPEPVRAMLGRSLDRIRPGDGIRLRLCLDDELVDVPWEFLYLPQEGGGESVGGFLALDHRVALVREPPTALLRVSPSSSKQRLVFAGTMYTDAGNSDLWDVQGEYERLRTALAPVADYLSIPFVTAAGDNIERALASKTAIFHYAGHADVAEGHGYLIRDLTQGRVGGTLLSETLDGLLVRAGTRLAAFSACNSGRWSFVGPLVRAGIPVVIGIQGNVFSVTATAFFEKLYASLAVGMSLDEAVSWARLHLLEPGVGLAQNSSEWGAFMVYMPTTEAVLFPRPRTHAVRRRQDAARRERQQTIINVKQYIVTQTIESNYGQVSGVTDGSSDPSGIPDSAQHRGAETQASMLSGNGEPSSSLLGGGRRAMAAEVMLIGVAKVALEEGARFLYDQAGKVLDAWRARRRDPSAPPPVLVPAPAEVTVGPAQPSSAKPDGDTVLTLEDLRADAERITSGELPADDPAARATIAALREIVEAALGTSITFAGEAVRPVRVSDVNIVVNDVRGRLAGVRLTTGQGADISKVRIEAHDVEAGGDLVGVDIGGGRPEAAPQPARPDRPIRVLFLAANPVDTDPLRLDEEMRAIDEALREADYRDRFEIRQQWAVRVGDLQKALLRHRPDIVHFSGHGTDMSEIVLEDESGASQVVPRDALGRLFSVLAGDIRCVVLNACYSETQAQAIAETIDCVVGMTSAVGDDSALQFATGFYRALGYGKSVQTAFELGTDMIGLEGLPDEDLPHLIARKMKAADVTFVAAG